MNDNTTHDQNQAELINYYEQLTRLQDSFIVPKPFVKAFGEFEALFLSVLCDLHKRNKWILNSYDEWHEKYFTWKSPQSIQRAVLLLEKNGILLSRQEKGFDKRKYYAPNKAAIAKAVMETEGE